MRILTLQELLQHQQRRSIPKRYPRSSFLQIATPQQQQQQTSDARDNMVRILCLHGKYDNAETFKTFLTPFRRELEAKLEATTSFENPKHVQFDYLDAPFIIGKTQGGKDDVMIASGSSNPSSRTNASAATSVNTNTHDKREWWTLPPGVRSFEATEYGGFQQSAELVEKAILNKNYDFILCHSQGSILMASLLCNPVWTRRVFGGDTRDNGGGMSSKKPKGYILNGCAWPKPFEEYLENLHENDASWSWLLGGMDHASPPASSPKMLFVMARDDPVNPTKGAERVRDCFRKVVATSSSLPLSGDGLVAVDTCYHDGDHSFPVNDKEAMEHIMHWIMDVVQTTTM